MSILKKNKKIVEITLVLLSILQLLMMKSEYLNDAIYIIVLVDTIMLFLLLKKDKQVLYIIRTSESHMKIYAFIFFILFLLMMDFCELFKSQLFDISSGIGKGRILFIAVLFGMTIPVFLISIYCIILYTICNTGTDKIVSKEKGYLKGCILFIVVVCTLILLSSYPGMYHGDGTNVLNNVLNDRWSDWHPITYYLFVRICMFGSNNPFSVIVVQTVLFTFTQYFALKVIEKYCGSRWCIFYTIGVLTLGVSQFLYLDVFYKDVPYTIGMVGFTISILAFIKEEKSNKALAGIFLYGLFAAFMRHMAFVMVIVTLLIIIIYGIFSKKKIVKRILIVTIAIMTVFISTKQILLAVTNTEKTPKYVSYTIPLHMLGAYAVNEKEMDEASRQLLNSIMPIEQWKEGYSKDKYLADNLSREWGVIGKNVDKIEENDLYDDIILANWRFLTRCPGKYISALMNINTLVWQMGQPEDGYEWISPVFQNCDNTLEEKFPQYEIQSTMATKILQPILECSQKKPIWRIITYRGGMFNYAILLSFLILWIR